MTDRLFANLDEVKKTTKELEAMGCIVKDAEGRWHLTPDGEKALKAHEEKEAGRKARLGWAS